MSRVALVRCEDYDRERVLAAVRRGIDLLGGPGAFAAPGERLLLKPNVLFGDPPERCTSTHPEVLWAVGRVFRDVAGVLSYGDSPAVYRGAAEMRRSGLAAAAESLGIAFADFDRGGEVPVPDSPFVRRIVLANGARDVDGIVSLPKMKAHALMRMTGAVKNQFGCVPGVMKARYHMRMHTLDEFARLLVTLTRMLAPRLYVVDGIWAMEGNGPRNGDRVPMNVLVLSRDPVAVDATLCRMMALDPALVPTMGHAEAWGLGTAREDRIERVGDPLASFVRPGFRVDRRPRPSANRLHHALSPFKRLLSDRPVIDPARCTACGLCVDVCPTEPKSLARRGPGRKAGPPLYDERRCIRCYCCQEVCPERAISVHRPWPGRLLDRF